MRAFNFCGGVALALGSAIATAAHLGPMEIAKLPSSAPTIIEAYGADPLQSGELRLPTGQGPLSHWTMPVTSICSLRPTAIGPRSSRSF